MIAAMDDVFPSNAVKVIATRIQAIDSDLYVARRELQTEDPPQSVGVFPVLWQPDEDSYEMRGGPIGRHEPTLQRYSIAIQAFIKNHDEELGIAEHSTLSKLIRRMLVRDNVLRTQLAQLSWTDGDSIERTTRWGMMTQRFVSSEIKKQWLYLSVTELFLDTETT